MTSKVSKRGELVRRFILENVADHPEDVGKVTAEHFGVTRQAVNKHLQKLCAEGVLKASGRTRSKHYELASIRVLRKVYSTTSQLEEDQVWRRDLGELFNELPNNVVNIWRYGFTEIFNNAIDHSASAEITVVVEKSAVDTMVWVSDDGVGIFKKIQSEMGFEDEHRAVLELSKGKLTTDPKRHTGEGIFFSSRMFDSFWILSGDVSFSHEFGKHEDWVFPQTKKQVAGTVVFMRLDNHTARTSKQVFDEFAPGDEFGFNKTVIPLELAQYDDDQLVSRSQAKRVLARVDLFKKVLFDFENIVAIGQAFADEIFRVFALSHPEMELIPINANDEVMQMIERARAHL